MIWEELRDDLIFYDLQAVDYKEVLQSMGDAMIQAGYGEEGFTEAVLEREKDYPTGLDIDEILKGLLSAQSKEEIRTAIQKREQAF